MCDYSLEHVQSRSAKVRDKLVSTIFGNSFARGFAAVGEPRVAVCLASGTELAFDRDAECDHPLGLFPSRKLGERMARFRHINPERRHEHHDALEFPSGRMVLVARLRPGQTATVLQLPVAQKASDDALAEQPRPRSQRPGEYPRHSYNVQPSDWSGADVVPGPDQS